MSEGPMYTLNHVPLTMTVGPKHYTLDQMGRATAGGAGAAAADVYTSNPDIGPVNIKQ